MKRFEDWLDRHWHLPMFAPLLAFPPFSLVVLVMLGLLWSAGERSTAQEPELALSVNGVAAPATKAQLLALLKDVPKDALMLIAYRGEDGDYHQLSEFDLREYGATP